MVDYNGLENRRAERHRGFESLSLRKTFRLVEFFSTSFFYAPSSLLECEHKKKLISTYVPG